MFTGIVEGVGTIDGVAENEQGVRLAVATPMAAELDAGASVSVDGACLTVESRSESWFEVFLSRETRAKTAFAEKSEGDPVNLERAMRADGRFEGHIVQGHVDTTAPVRSVTKLGEDWEYEFGVPAGFEQYVVSKGSVALDGVSLTVAERGEDSFSVAVIPTTRAETTFSSLQEGDRVNVEFDIVAKYVERLVEASGAARS